MFTNKSRVYGIVPLYCVKMNEIQVKGHGDVQLYHIIKWKKTTSTICIVSSHFAK